MVRRYPLLCVGTVVRSRARLKRRRLALRGGIFGGRHHGFMLNHVDNARNQIGVCVQPPTRCLCPPSTIAACTSPLHSRHRTSRLIASSHIRTYIPKMLTWRRQICEPIVLWVPPLNSGWYIHIIDLPLHAWAPDTTKRVGRRRIQKLAQVRGATTTHYRPL